jgi:putative alpha-1,2-mannosidase
VQSLSLNGKRYESLWLPYDELARGARLNFKLAGTPNKEWGSKPSEAPPSFDDGASVKGGVKQVSHHDD